MSLIFETLELNYSPIPNFKIVNFTAGNIDLKKIRQAGIYQQDEMIKSTSVFSDVSFDFDV